jgi:hypothetical protein
MLEDKLKKKLSLKFKKTLKDFEDQSEKKTHNISMFVTIMNCKNLLLSCFSSLDIKLNHICLITKINSKQKK